MPRSITAIAPLLVLLATGSYAQEVIPHRQDRLPNRPYSPEEAIEAMTVPPGFPVELVASEPDIVNPVAMTFDERGRIWITESLEYPRKQAGPGRDRVKVLEDTDGDGKADKFTVFADGLNIPFGIAVGHGGVWVPTRPTSSSCRTPTATARRTGREVVVTGFGRADTHELPNSLTWGPDGWLYGLNGVFNPSRITSGGKDYRLHLRHVPHPPADPRVRGLLRGDEQPLGHRLGPRGQRLRQACTVHRPPLAPGRDRLLPPPGRALSAVHLEDRLDRRALAPEGGLLRHPLLRQRRLPAGVPRQALHGQHPRQLHQRRRAEPATARPTSASAEPDFLTANDAWFMPVAQKTGPDGCLYILDWYDRYHCYQDANRDPDGIDRLKGRLYRVRYRDTPRRRGSTWRARATSN